MKMKEKVLDMAKKTGMESAIRNRDLACRYFFHQPKAPAALLKKTEKK